MNRSLNRWALALLFASSIAIAAPKDHTPRGDGPSNQEGKSGMSCVLKSGEGPFSKFEWKTVAGKPRMTVTWMNLTGLESANDEHAVITDIRRKSPEERNYTSYYFDLQDWAGGNLFQVEDDEGKAVFIFFYADGPRLTGYYRCSDL